VLGPPAHHGWCLVQAHAPRWGVSRAGGAVWGSQIGPISPSTRTCTCHTPPHGPHTHTCLRAVGHKRTFAYIWPATQRTNGREPRQTEPGIAPPTRFKSRNKTLRPSELPRRAALTHNPRNHAYQQPSSSASNSNSSWQLTTHTISQQSQQAATRNSHATPNANAKPPTTPKTDRHWRLLATGQSLATGHTHDAT
jgi:hypothetical protein